MPRIQVGNEVMQVRCVHCVGVPEEVPIREFDDEV